MKLVNHLKSALLVSLLPWLLAASLLAFCSQTFAVTPQERIEAYTLNIYELRNNKIGLRDAKAMAEKIDSIGEQLIGAGVSPDKTAHIIDDLQTVAGLDDFGAKSIIQYKARIDSLIRQNKKGTAFDEIADEIAGESKSVRDAAITDATKAFHTTGALTDLINSTYDSVLEDTHNKLDPFEKHATLTYLTNLKASLHEIEHISIGEKTALFADLTNFQSMMNEAPKSKSMFSRFLSYITSCTKAESCSVGDAAYELQDRYPVRELKRRSSIQATDGYGDSVAASDYSSEDVISSPEELEDFLNQASAHDSSVSSPYHGYEYSDQTTLLTLEHDYEYGPLDDQGDSAVSDHDSSGAAGSDTTRSSPSSHEDSGRGTPEEQPKVEPDQKPPRDDQRPPIGDDGVHRHIVMNPTFDPPEDR